MQSVVRGGTRARELRRSKRTRPATEQQSDEPIDDHTVRAKPVMASPRPAFQPSA